MTLLGGALGLAVLFWWGLGSRRAARPVAAPSDAAPAPLPVAAASTSLPPLPQLPTPPPRPKPGDSAPTADPARLKDEDASRANRVIERLQATGRVEEADLPLADELAARYPDETGLLELREHVLLLLAGQRRGQRRYADAQALVRRAIAHRPRSLPPRALLSSLLLELNDFAGAEAAARDGLQLDPRSHELHYLLAHALFRQDRNREALEAAQASLALQENEPARALQAVLLKTRQDEGRMTEQQLSHFHVRYDGEAHEDVGREILRALERHYATLARALDHQPQAAIPVILFSREQYASASGAPVWSGGVYDSLDGRIRIPIAGLTTSLSPRLDETLVHELVHAFLADKTRGTIQHASPVNEGFAQYMEGHRAGPQVAGARLAAVIEALPATHPQQCGSLSCVQGFYLGALSFVEYLIGLRGLGGMNDLFASMGETGSVDESFRRVYGQDYNATRQAWRARF
jgi:tetratricopeptide (TPR) repeat protein